MDWVKASVITFITVIVGLNVAGRMTFEDDPVKSLRETQPAESALYKKYTVASPFQSKLYFERGTAKEAEVERFLSFVQTAGYAPANLAAVKGDWSDLILIAPAMLSAQRLTKAMSAESVAAHIEEAKTIVWLPAGAGYLSLMDQDPLGLAGVMADVGIKNLGMTSLGSSGDGIVTWDSPKKISFTALDTVWDEWTKIADKTHLISSDFFALANFRAIRRDIFLTLTLSFLLNAGLSWYFFRRWELIALLALGSTTGLTASLLLLGAGGGAVFTLAFGLMAAFVGLNNAFLTHYCTLSHERRVHARLTFGGSLGMMLGGWAILILIDAVMISQMALAAMFSLIAFLAYFYLFRDAFGRMRIRPIKIPSFACPSRFLSLGTLILVIIVFLLGPAKLHTSVTSLSVNDVLLNREAAYFGTKASHVGGGDELYAVEVTKDVFGVFERLRGRLGNHLHFHPLSLYVDPARQREVIDSVLKPRYLGAVRETITAMAREGIHLNVPHDRLPAFRVVQPEEFLTRLSLFLPAPVWIEDGGQSWLVFGASSGSVDIPNLSEGLGRPIIPLSPKLRHDIMLTEISHELAWVAAAALVLTLVYLYFRRQGGCRALAFAFPMLATWAFILTAARLSPAGDITLAQLMGFCLVAAITLNHVSSKPVFDAQEENDDALDERVLISGLSILAGFGALILASHPFLRDIGIVVTVGTAFSLALTLLTRVSPKEPHA
jgi:hypothetical protein